MKYGISTLIAVLLAIAYPSSLKAQKLALKSNLVAWATTTPNLGFEMAVDNQYTVQLFGSYNPFTLKENNKLKHWLVQPEVRWWTKEAFNGHFVGLHLIGGQFNAGSIKLPFNILPDLDTHRYEGWGIGGGISYGYQWKLSERWNLETSLGLGYARLSYDKFPYEKCSKKIGEEKKNYFGPTKVALSIIYIIK
ncbi:DUF3575 domain-containing protein [Parabacteroides goldsteinii]|jgi:hypothetical protein|uniref:DUF3575 domain-containing protein n=1 Tax=Parabacteroides goldsteinii TaxID=328812 RepID=UPI001CC972A0|nr:DUF3575 domain-containing protein [Parabacteroides goldsteinii]UBD77416.1 DUF3575 domain-containing protein [Parabacteroides goldsteinii]